MREPERTTAAERAEAYGIDLTLIDLQLSMTPDERVRAHESAWRLAQELVRAGEEYRARHGKPGPAPR